jgi:hypothetical protein
MRDKREGCQNGGSFVVELPRVHGITGTVDLVDGALHPTVEGRVVTLMRDKRGGGVRM